MLISLASASRGRFELFEAAVRRIYDLAKKPKLVELRVRVDEDDPQLERYLNTPWHVLVGPRLGKGAAPHINASAMLCDGGVVMQFTDDQWCLTEGWDELVRRTAKKYVAEPTVFWYDELREGKRENLAVNMAWLRAAGYFYPQGPKHFFSDTWLGETAEALGRLVRIPGLVIEHRKFISQDQTFKDARSRGKEDEKAYKALSKETKRLKESIGVRASQR